MRVTGLSVLLVQLSCLLPLNSTAAVAPPATGTSAEFNRVIAQALRPPSLERNLQQLTDGIGGRIPGTPAMQEAIEWAQQAFRAAGGENVHTEAFQIPHSWTEGDTQFWVDAPLRFEVHSVSVAWAPS